MTIEFVSDIEAIEYVTERNIEVDRSEEFWWKAVEIPDGISQEQAEKEYKKEITRYIVKCTKGYAAGLFKGKKGICRWYDDAEKFEDEGKAIKTARSLSKNGLKENVWEVITVEV